jgi:diguanylate cyclase (GGDEF)-like protein
VREQLDKRQMAYTAAAMYGGAAGVALIEGVFPGGPELSLAPGLFALVVVSLLVAFGPRLPMPVLAALGPLGAAMIAYAIATTPPGQGEGALLYIWPVLWVAYFFGRTASILIVVWVGIVQGVALIASDGVLDRWIDVLVSVAIVAAVVQALSERNKRLVQHLEAEARVDQLTGVLNRRGFLERAPDQLARASRDGAWLAAVSFDIDHFKRVNDEFGHEVGDRVLAHLGAVLRAETRSVDIVGRLGGEEFTALLAGSDARRAFAYAERVRHHFADLDDPGLPSVTISAGIAAAAAPESVERLLHDADSALYKAKRAGRDRAVADQPAALQIVG